MPTKFGSEHAYFLSQEGAVMAFFVTLAAVSLAWYLWEKSQRRTYPMAGGLHPEIALPHTEEYELYHNGLSLCSKKVRVCLRELGIPFAEHHIDLVETGSYEVLSRHFLKVNPAGLLPVLVHKGHPVYESHDIITYCAQQAPHDAPALVPQDAGARELMKTWMDRASLKGEDVVAGLADSAAVRVGNEGDSLPQITGWPAVPPDQVPALPVPRTQAAWSGWFASHPAGGEAYGPGLRRHGATS